MKHAYIAIAALAIGIVVILTIVFGMRWNTNRLMMLAADDSPDKDFVAEVARTDKPYVFDVTVRKVNQKAKKTIQICGATPIQVDFILTNESGKKYPDSVYSNGEYAEEIGTKFSDINKVTQTTTATAPFRLKTEKLQPGKYTLEPRVRIYEEGSDARSGGCSDFGSVAVPSSGSITIEVK